MGFSIQMGSRADALQACDLYDVSTMATEAGFRIPLALTAQVWEDCVSWNPEKEEAYQDEEGRKWDVVWMASRAALHAKKSESPTVSFQVFRVKHGELEPTIAELVLWIGPDDAMEPVCTVYTQAEVSAMEAY